MGRAEGEGYRRQNDIEYSIHAGDVLNGSEIARLIDTMDIRVSAGSGSALAPLFLHFLNRNGVRDVSVNPTSGRAPVSCVRMEGI